MPPEKHHDRLLFQFRRELADGPWEIAELIDADRQRIPKGAELHFVIVARVEQRDGAAFIQPALELAGCELRRGAPDGVDPFHPECDDLFFDSHQHPAKRLVIGFADLDLQGLQARQAPELRQ